MPIPELVVGFVQPWADLYAESKGVETTLMFTHFAGLLVGGGFALATDRLALRASGTRHGTPFEMHRALQEMAAVHRPVLIGLALTMLTGILLLAADLEAMIALPSFWVKLTLLALLLLNGRSMQRTEQRLRAVHAAPPESLGVDGGRASTARLWRRLRLAAMTSFALWLAVTLAGVWVTNA